MHVNRYLTSNHSTIAHGKSAAQGAIILRTFSKPLALGDVTAPETSVDMTGDVIVPEAGNDTTGNDTVPEAGIGMTGKGGVLKTG